MENGIGAIHIFRFTKLISHSLLTFIRVNCAILAVTDFAIAAMHLAVSLGNFTLCGERLRALPSGHPLPFEQSEILAELT